MKDWRTAGQGGLNVICDYPLSVVLHIGGNFGGRSHESIPSSARIGNSRQQTAVKLADTQL